MVATTREARETVFELILAVGIPTEIPRVGFTIETIFVPFGETDTAPVHRRATAADSSAGASFRDNGIEIELELNLTTGSTGGADRRLGREPLRHRGQDQPRWDPRRLASVYTHKLNFELDTAFLPVQLACRRTTG